MKLISILFLLTLAQCASSNAGIATSNIPIIDKPYKVIGPVEEQTSWWVFDIAIIGGTNMKPPMDKLVESAISKKDADALINIKYWSDRAVFLFITRNRIGLSAEAVKFESETVAPNAKKTR